MNVVAVCLGPNFHQPVLVGKSQERFRERNLGNSDCDKNRGYDKECGRNQSLFHYSTSSGFSRISWLPIHSTECESSTRMLLMMARAMLNAASPSKKIQFKDFRYPFRLAVILEIKSFMTTRYKKKKPGRAELPKRFVCVETTWSSIPRRAVLRA